MKLDSLPCSGLASRPNATAQMSARRSCKCARVESSSQTTEQPLRPTRDDRTTWATDSLEHLEKTVAVTALHVPDMGHHVDDRLVHGDFGDTGWQRTD